MDLVAMEDVGNDRKTSYFGSYFTITFMIHLWGNRILQSVNRSTSQSTNQLIIRSINQKSILD